ncbi:MAG: TIGR02147 family protein [Fibrobacterales bacterium]
MNTPIEKPRIFEYLDPVSYLNDFCNWKSATTQTFSIRNLATKLAIDSSNLFKITQGSRPFPVKAIAALSTFARFKENETEYFTALLLYAKAKTEEKKAHAKQVLINLQEPLIKTVSNDKHDFYTSWYHSAIYTLLDYYSFNGKNYAALARTLNPSITTEEAKESIALLSRLGYIYQNSDGFYKNVEMVLGTGAKWRSEAISTYQKNLIQLAEQSMDSQKRDQRDISSMTVSLAREDIDAIKKMIHKLQLDALKRAHKSEQSDAVYQLNVQLFSLTK